MPNYEFKCGACETRWTELLRLGGPWPKTCWKCEAPDPQRVITTAAQVRIRHTMKGDMSDYREDLARFPGDPQAFVDGPRALKRLIDQRKREGCRIGTIEEAANFVPGGSEPKNLAAEAYEAAKKNGFRLEGE